MFSRKKELGEIAPLLPLKKHTKTSHEDEDDHQTRKVAGFKEESQSSVTVLQLFRFASPQDKTIMVIGTIFAIIHGSGGPILGFVFGNMANQFLGDWAETEHSTASSKMGSYCVIYASLGVLTLFSAFIQTYCWEVAAASLVFKLRRQFFRQVLRQQINWFDEHQTGDLTLNLLDDLERFQEGVGQSFSAAVQYMSAFLLGIAVGLGTCWQLTVLITMLTPILSLKAAVVGKYVIRKMAEEKEKYAKAGCLSIETFSSNRTVAAFGGEKREIEKYKNALTEGLQSAKKRILLQAAGIGFSFFCLYSCQGVAFWYGGKLINDMMASPGSILTVMTSTMMGVFALGHAIPYFSIISIAQTAAERVYKIIDTIPSIDPYSTTGAYLDKVVGKIQFSNVYFSYPARLTIPVLKRLDFTVLPGQTVGLVGTSGSGKSTIVNMLLRFYDPQSGEILLDGNDIKSLNLHWLRNQIGYVSQEPVLFSTTIYDNILLGTTKEVSHQEVIDAAKMANVHEFIVSLPQGYNTEISGTKLSGGQKQRIAIARAIISNPKILLLDEATSALDAKSEALVQVGLRKAMKGRTTIIIAHRLSTIRDADVIYALKDGLIVESGTHENLMEVRGLYYDLVMAQAPLETVEDTDGYSVASTVESVDDSAIDFEYKQLKQRRRAMSNRLSMSIDALALEHVDKAQMLKEVKELHLEMPGIFKILKKGGQGWILLIGLIGALLAGCVRPSHAFLFGEMIIAFTEGGNKILEITQFLATIYLFLGGIAGIGYFVDILFVSWAGENLTTKLRLDSYTAVIRQQISWYDEDSNSPARISARLARDAPLVNIATGERLAIAMIAVTTITMSLSLAFYFGWRLASVLFVAFPALVVSGYIQVMIQAGGQLRDSEYIETAGNMAIESMQSIRTIQALCQESYFYSRYRECVEPVYLEARKQGAYFGIALGLSATIIYFVYSGTFWYGARMIDEGVMTQDNIYRVFFLVAFCAVAIGHMTTFIPDFQKGRLASALIFNLMELESEIDPMSVEGTRPEIRGNIEFKDVFFSYPARPDTRVLQGLSFKIEAGQTLAVIGMSGSGKSTVVSLLERFYDVSSGVVSIDGTDIRKINVRHLRKHIGLVQQEPVLFDTTIRENIAYGYVSKNGSGSPTHEEIVQSARDANIHDFIMKLPRGYDTVVGERAVQLSGGQKQRVAIARALIRNPRILLLDEATSALDTESEQIVQEALDRARAGRTCVIIAHRLSTIQNADVIAVVSNGRIMEIGTPEKLMARKGIYYKITKKQRMQFMDL